MATQAARGKKALDTSQFDEAIEAYSAALKEFPKSPDYLIQRSTAFQRAKRFTEALNDAEHAVINAQARAKKELIVEAQLRRGIALFGLSRLADAEFVFGLVKSRNAEHKVVQMWINKTSLAMKNIDADDKRRKVTVTEVPSPQPLHLGITDSKSAEMKNAASATSTGSVPQEPPKASQTPLEKIRHEWYQSSEAVYITLFAKGVPKDQAQIDIGEDSLSISFPLVTGSTYDLTLDPLFAPVKSEKCITTITANKVEIILTKAVPSLKWSALEGKDSGVAITAPSQVAAPAVPDGPSYPSSSKSGPKDWDKITQDISTSDDKEKSGEADDDEDDDGGDPANAFFKKLFKNASPEMQRAMMKSYTESNGTALSTNWDEVSKGKVETVPPDGMEAKRW